MRDIQHGLKPWWSWPAIKLRFFRPLAVATLYVDALLFSDSTWHAHVHNVLWQCLASFCSTLLALRITRQRGAALLAGVLTSVDDTRVVPVLWLAMRNALVALTFGSLALLAYAYEQRMQQLRWLGLSACLFLAALLASENITCLLPAFLAYSWLMDPRPRHLRLRACAAICGVSLAWLVSYKVFGFGAAGSGSYLDPFGDWRAFWRALPGRAASMFHLHFGAPPLLDQCLPGAWLHVVDMLALWTLFPAALVYVIRRSDRDRELAFWALTACAGLIPLAAAEPHERLLTHLALPLWMVVSKMLLELRAAPAFGLQHGVTASLGVVLLGVHLILPATTFTLAPETLTRIPSAPAFDAPNVASRVAVVINAPSVISTPDVIARRMGLSQPFPWRLVTLGATRQEVEVTRLDAYTLELYTPQGYGLDDPFVSAWRSPSLPLTQGFRVQADEFDALVIRTTPDGRPLRVRFRFRVVLDDPALQFVYWNADHQLHEFWFAPIGQRTILAADADHTRQLPEQLVRF